MKAKRSAKLCLFQIKPNMITPPPRSTPIPKPIGQAVCMTPTRRISPSQSPKLVGVRFPACGIWLGRRAARYCDISIVRSVWSIGHRDCRTASDGCGAASEAGRAEASVLQSSSVTGPPHQHARRACTLIAALAKTHTCSRISEAHVAELCRSVRRIAVTLLTSFYLLPASAVSALSKSASRPVFESDTMPPDSNVRSAVKGFACVTDLVRLEMSFGSFRLGSFPMQIDKQVVQLNRSLWINMTTHCYPPRLRSRCRSDHYSPVLPTYSLR